MEKPTIVVITDRNDLDGQLFGVFSLAQDLLREQPVQATTRQQLRRLLSNRLSGGIVFATIQKFMPGEDEDMFPVLSDRHNIVVIADEAHRTQYGFEAKLKTRKLKSDGTSPATAVVSADGAPGSAALTADYAPPEYRTSYQVGYAQHLRDALPRATFVAFTGTPVSSSDRDTRAVFGDHIHVYDMQQAKEDGATVARSTCRQGCRQETRCACSFYMTQLFPKGGWGKVRTMKQNPDGRPKSWEATVIDEDRPMGMSSQQHQTQHQKVQVLYLDIGYKCFFKQQRFILLKILRFALCILHFLRI